ncbi:ATP-binding cassette domain-containing protein [bacterium]|nr:MAG: ATP-binding cassette domain-containing protein [bacterium]
MVNLIEVEGVSVVREKRTILHDLSLTVPIGGHVAILGPNGCGKSTLIKLLTRELYGHAGRGRYRVMGRERWTQSELRTELGVVSGEPREPLLGQPTGLDLVISGLFGTYGVLAQRQIAPEMVEHGRASLARVDAGHLAEQPLETMSTGEERRCWIARALVSEPKGLVLDEPTAGLDFVARGQFLETIQGLASAATIVLVTHHLEEVIPEIGRVVLMREGRIVADGPREDVLTRERVAEAFGCSPEDVPL